MRDTSVSIIIPTLNEEAALGPLLSLCRTSFADAEIIVADGGSKDGTVGCAEAAGVRIVNAPRGRASQMNAGADVAAGEILWFLHADCMPTTRAVSLLCQAMDDESVAGGGFRWVLDGDRWYYPFVTRLAHLKNRIKRNLYGDMGIFVRTSVFRELGGYAPLPFLEDMDLCRRLHRKGKIVILNEPLVSSDRRLLKRGPLRSFILNDVIKMAYRMGVSPETLMKWYYRR
jgi:rSAM/selenodomain-associated transferase 2